MIFSDSQSQVLALSVPGLAVPLAVGSEQNTQHKTLPMREHHVSVFTLCILELLSLLGSFYSSWNLQDIGTMSNM